MGERIPLGRARFALVVDVEPENGGYRITGELSDVLDGAILATTLRIEDTLNTFDHLGNRVDLSEPLTVEHVAEMLQRKLSGDDPYTMWKVTKVEPGGDTE